MTGTEFIAQHLHNEPFLPIHKGLSTVCAFSGQNIIEGVRLKDTLSGNFSDSAYVRYASDYCGVSVAKCIKPMSGDGKASLRNYSFLVTENALTLLSKSDWLDALLRPYEGPYILVISYNWKKHVSYKTAVQYRNDVFTVFTDAGEVDIVRADVDVVLPILQRWYTILPDKADKPELPTYFNKTEMRTGKAPMRKIEAYGMEQFFAENEILAQYRRRPMFYLLSEAVRKIIP